MKVPHIGTIQIPINRRTFIKTALSGAVASSLFPTSLFAENERISFDNFRVVPIGRNQKPLIFFWLDGGLSHIDTFCPMPDAPQEVKGPYGIIQSSIPGLLVSEMMPNTAGVMDKVLLLKNIYHTQGDHRAAINRLFTGNDGTINGPPTHIPFSVKLNEHLSRINLGYVIFTPDGTVSSGLGPNDALVLSRNYYGRDPKNRPYDSPFDRNFDREVDRRRLISRMALLRQTENRSLIQPQALKWDTFRERVNSMLEGDIDSAFDLSKVPERELERYGRTDLGHAALISKRMIEIGLPFTLIYSNNWDHHKNIKSELDSKLPSLDKALASLISDLSDRAIIVLASEFGRTPQINAQGGRDHWPQANIMLIAGPGIKPNVLGNINNRGEISSERYKAELMGPTILRACGYELREDRNGALSADSVPYYPIF